MKLKPLDYSILRMIYHMLKDSRPYHKAVLFK